MFGVYDPRARFSIWAHTMESVAVLLNMGLYHGTGGFLRQSQYPLGGGFRDAPSLRSPWLGLSLPAACLAGNGTVLWEISEDQTIRQCADNISFFSVVCYHTVYCAVLLQHIAAKPTTLCSSSSANCDAGVAVALFRAPPPCHGCRRPIWMLFLQGPVYAGLTKLDLKQ